MTSDPLYDLDVYQRRHLAAQLAELGWTTELDQLLALEVRSGSPLHPDRRNAWYESKAEMRDRAGYAEDIDLALDLATRDLEAARPPDRAAALGRQCRYALVRASLTALAENAPPTLLGALVLQGLWTYRRALDSASRVPDEDDRAEALAQLAPSVVASGLVADALNAARAISDEGARSWALAGLAASVPDDLVEPVIRDAAALADEQHRGGVYASLCGRVRLASTATKLLAEELAAMIEHPIVADLIAALAPHLSGTEAAALWERARISRRADVVATVGLGVSTRLDGAVAASVLDGALTAARRDRSLPRKARALALLGHPDEAIDNARRIEGGDSRAETLAALGAHLPRSQLEPLVIDVLGMKSQRRKTAALAELAPLLSDALVDQAIDAVAAMKRYDSRTAGLRALATAARPSAVGRLFTLTLELPKAQQRAAVLGELASRLDADQLQAALDATCRLRRPGDRGIQLASLAAALSDDMKEETLAWVLRIGSAADRSRCVDALAPHLAADQLERAAESLGRIDDECEASNALEPPSRPLAGLCPPQTDRRAGDSWSRWGG